MLCFLSLLYWNLIHFPSLHRSRLRFVPIVHSGNNMFGERRDVSYDLILQKSSKNEMDNKISLTVNIFSLIVPKGLFHVIKFVEVFGKPLKELILFYFRIMHQYCFNFLGKKQRCKILSK